MLEASTPGNARTPSYHERRYGMAPSPRASTIADVKSANRLAPAFTARKAYCVPSVKISGSMPVRSSFVSLLRSFFASSSALACSSGERFENHPFAGFLAGGRPASSFAAGEGAGVSAGADWPIRRRTSSIACMIDAAESMPNALR